MNVDTDTFSAISAEAEMLRKHAERAAPGRHRRPPRPAGWRRPWTPGDGMWWGGHVTAMQEIVDQANAAYERTSGHDRAVTVASVLRDVLDLAEGVIRLNQVDWAPPDWLSDGSGR